MLRRPVDPGSFQGTRCDTKYHHIDIHDGKLNPTGQLCSWSASDRSRWMFKGNSKARIEGDLICGIRRTARLVNPYAHSVTIASPSSAVMVSLFTLGFVPENPQVVEDR